MTHHSSYTNWAAQLDYDVSISMWIGGVASAGLCVMLFCSNGKCLLVSLLSYETHFSPLLLSSELKLKVALIRPHYTKHYTKKYTNGFTFITLSIVSWHMCCIVKCQTPMSYELITNYIKWHKNERTEGYV